MIPSREFKRLAVLFGGKILVNLVIYTDESGTHDRAHAQPGSRVPVLCGYIDTGDNWAAFCDSWKPVLDKYGVKYFHFNELTRTCRSKPGTQHHGWNDDRVADYIYDLALVASKTAVPIGGMCDGSEAIKHSKDPFKEIFEKFFEAVSATISHVWPNYGRQVEFIFDRKDGDLNWGNILNQTYAARAKTDARFGTVAFSDKLKCLPLQAADMIAYATRQAADVYWPENHSSQPKAIPPRILDLVLYRNMIDAFPSPIAFKGMEISMMKFFLDLLRHDEQQQKQAWRKIKQGSKIYYPHEHLVRIKAKIDNVGRIIQGLPPIILPPSKYGL